MNSHYDSDAQLSSEGNEDEWFTSEDGNGEERDVGADPHSENDDNNYISDESVSEDGRSEEDIKAAVSNLPNSRPLLPLMLM